MYKLFFILISFFFVSPLYAGIAYDAGKGYCSLTNPTEWLSPIRKSPCEEQHVIQQQFGGGDTENIVWWSASEHVRTDIWRDKPWENSRPWFVFGFNENNNMNLEKAYMLGTYGVSYSLFQHSYHGRGDSSLFALEFDGASNLLYSWSFIINQPQKQLNQLAYIVDKGHWLLLVDWIIGLGVMVLEISAAILMAMIGCVLGTILNPIDTLLAIPSAVVLGLESIIPAVLQTIGGGYRLIIGIF